VNMATTLTDTCEKLVCAQTILNATEKKKAAISIAQGTVLACSFLLTACGGGAGDTSNLDEPARASLVEPLEGTWDIAGDWNGEPNDEAYLVVRPVDADNEAEVIIYDFDDAATGLGRNCFTPSNATGNLEESQVDSVFLNLTVFPDAVAQLDAAGNLLIEFGESNARQTYSATRIGIAEADITPLC